MIDREWMEFVGRPVCCIPTPCLVIEYELLLQNIERMRRTVDSFGKHLRAHAKTHKCSRLAHLQIEHGAIGQCVAKLSEAEKLARSGVKGILVTGPIVTAQAHERLIECARFDPCLIITLDDINNGILIAGMAERYGICIEWLLDIDVGQGRTGIPPDEAVSFVKALSSSKGLKFRGVQAYAGHVQHIQDLGERELATRAANTLAMDVGKALESSGHNCEIVSAGGTGSVAFDVTAPAITEIQAGSYIFMDADYAAVEFQGGRQPFETALTLHSTVVNARRSNYAIVDAGLKSVYRDGPPPQVVHPERQELVYDWAGDEFGKVSVSEGVALDLKIGDRLQFMVSHCDPTVNLFDNFFVIEEGHVRDVWPIDLRGLSF
jgi:D-serine deaminase-like pyridoxal phosphate-dependent protein